MKLQFTGRALDDLNRLRAFIASDNPQAARRIGETLRQSIRRLLDQPHMGQAVDERPGVRRWVSGPYVVHYQVEAQTLIVLRVRHGREQKDA